MDKLQKVLVVALTTVLIAGGLAAAALISISGTSSATATQAPSQATFGSVSIGALSSPEIAGTCTGGSGLSSFSCTGTSLTVGNSYSLTASVTDPTSSTEPVTITYSDSGTWTGSCSLNGSPFSTGASVNLNTGSNALSCSDSAPSGPSSADTFTVGISG